MAKPKAKVGDIFEIPLVKDVCAFGQILAKYEREMLLLVVFDYRHEGSARPPIETVLASKPLLMCNSMDALIYHGRWPIVDNQAPDTRALPLPNYKVMIGGRMHVEDYYAQKTRPLRVEEDTILTFRKCVAPVGVEKAVRAYWGYEPMNDRYEELRAEYALASAQVRVDR